MRWFRFLLVLALFTPALAEQVVERQGWKVLSFDVPGMELLGAKDNRLTRATYAKQTDDGEIKITVLIKSWMAIDTYETTFREEKEAARSSGEARLRPELQVPGAVKVLSYSQTAPYNAAVIILYSKDFRCQLSVTGGKGKEAEAEVESTYQQLAKTLTMRGLSPISPIRVESENDDDDEE